MCPVFLPAFPNAGAVRAGESGCSGGPPASFHVGHILRWDCRQVSYRSPYRFIIMHVARRADRGRSPAADLSSRFAFFWFACGPPRVRSAE
ncbi:MAG: hypothetical protein D6744_18965 [Planctomycetota bacterium]|nr:MAG: hypothetical protein D6744_18965 [Planctomycetota bacterium]